MQLRPLVVHLFTFSLQEADSVLRSFLISYDVVKSYTQASYPRQVYRSEVQASSRDNDRCPTHMEAAGATTATAFRRVFIDRSQAENQVIPYDVEKMKELGLGEEVTHAVHRHFLDSLQVIQRASGSDEKFDFQHYNWGFRLALDPHLPDDEKLSTLFAFYCQHARDRLILQEFEQIVKKHSSFRHLDAFHKRIKWDDLVASFQLHATKKTHQVHTIGMKNMIIILESNKISIDIDIPRLMSFIRRLDKTSRNLFALLEEDPLLNGQSQSLSLYA